MNPRPCSIVRACAAPLACLALACLGPAACTQTRADQLRAKSDRVGAELTSEKRRVLESPPGPERDQRLDRLTGLRTALSATNISLGAVPRLVAPENRDMAYDLIEEAYETIRWNIPLAPGEPERPMPASFRGGMLVPGAGAP